MELLGQLSEALAYGFRPQSLLIITAGVAVGIVVGAAPGLTGTVGITLLLPVGLTMPPEDAIVLFAGVLCGSSFGNSIPAVLLKVPGTPSALLTAEEGHPFHQRGEGGRALLVCLFSSVAGQLFGVLVFVLFIIPLSQIAVRLLFPEIFAIVLLGLLTAAGLVSAGIAKGVVAIAIGLMLSVVGLDPVTGVTRMTFGVDGLFTGLPQIPVIVGLLAFRQILVTVGDLEGAPSQRPKSLRVGFLSRKDWKDMWFPTTVGSAVGTFIGIMPGAGSSVASFVAYDVVKRSAKDKSQFGKGTSVKGLAAVDSSANSAIGGELIPTFGLGIPGAPPMIIIMAVLSAQGLIPGPQLMATRPTLLTATFGGLLVGVLVLGVIGYLAIGPSVYLSKLSPPATMVVATILVVVGVYSLRWSVFDVWVSLIAGVIGYFLDKHGYSVIAISLAFILGGMMEASLRRGLIMTSGWQDFIFRPVTMAILGLGVLLIIFSAMTSRRLKGAEQESEK